MFTLADAKNLSQDKLTQYIIDEFRKSPILESLVFDDVVKPQGKSMAYTYNRVSTLPTAASRAIGNEYTPQEAKTTQHTVNLKVFGGSFQIDRVVAADETQIADLVQFELQQKIQATRALFADLFINGDSATTATDFDGIDKSLTGSSTERKLTTALDMSTAAKVEANWKQFLYELRQTIKLMNGAPSIIGVNNDMFAVFQSVADFSTQFQQTRTDLGTEIVKYGSSVIMNMGDKPGTSNPIIKTDSTTGATDIYMIRVGLDGVHGVTPTGQKEPKIYLPDMNAVGAVKTGEVEMVAAVAIKATRAAAVLRGIKIA